mmetsp:Transcript_62233/g.134870  ORF Transcript_62233/g.134870 Transcript_62233/m.134870 type:complete len:101 (+) Transcript_62233:592-894(+)
MDQCDWFEPKLRQELELKLEWAQQCQQNGEVTVPSTINEELKFNMFLRAAVGSEDILRLSQFEDRRDAIHWVRQNKNLWGKNLSKQNTNINKNTITKKAE